MITYPFCSWIFRGICGTDVSVYPYDPIAPFQGIVREFGESSWVTSELELTSLLSAPFEYAQDTHLRMREYWVSQDQEWLPDTVLNGMTTSSVLHEDGRVVRVSLQYLDETRSVYHIERWPELILKYSLNCGSGVHSALREYWFARLLQRMGLSVAPVYISPEISVPDPDNDEQRSWKIKSLGCGSGRHSPVRMLILKRPTGMYFSALVSRGVPLPLNRAIVHTIRVINFLEKIHRMNVIHGNVVPSSFAYDSVTGQLLSLDLSHARIFSLDSSQSTGPSPRSIQFADLATGNYPLEYMTAWEWRAPYIASFRNDIMRALFTLPFLLYGEQYFDHQRIIARHAHGAVWLYERKKSGNIFELKHHDKNHQMCLDNVPGKVGRILRNVVNLVLDTPPSGRPPYEAIRALLHSIHSV